jgi:hypothetical protein
MCHSILTELWVMELCGNWMRLASKYSKNGYGGSGMGYDIRDD